MSLVVHEQSEKRYYCESHHNCFVIEWQVRVVQHPKTVRIVKTYHRGRSFESNVRSLQGFLDYQAWRLIGVLTDKAIHPTRLLSLAIRASSIEIHHIIIFPTQHYQHYNLIIWQINPLNHPVGQMLQIRRRWSRYMGLS